MASKLITPSRSSKKETQSVPLTFDTVAFSPCNYIALLDNIKLYLHFHDIADFLRKCPLYKALTYAPKMSKFLLANFWVTCVYDDTAKEVRASVLSKNDVVFNVDDVRRVFDLPSYSCYDEIASVDDLSMVISVMGYVQDPSVKSQGTLYRKCMGGVWNFFFSHLIHCLSSKIGGMDQSPNSLTQLAHALIFQKKIDFAAYFFGELVKKMDSSKSCKVPFVRFFSMLIADKLGTRMPADVDNYYDLKVSQIGFQTLKKASLPTDLPLPLSMVSFANSPNPVWGAFSMSKNASKSVGTLSLSATSSKKAASLKPSKIKRKHSQLSLLGSCSNKAKKPKKAKNTSLVKDSQKLKVVEISPSELRASTRPPPSSFMPSRKDTLVHLGIVRESTLASLYHVNDDSDTSSFQGPSSPPIAHDVSPEIDNLDDIAWVNDTSTTTNANLHAEFSSKFDILAAKATVIKEQQDADYCAKSDHTCTLGKLKERIDGFSTTLSRTNELLSDFATNHVDFVSNVFKDIKSHNDQADIRVSTVTSAITDLSAKISDTFASSSGIHQSSLNDLNVRVTAIAESQSTILKSLEDLRARSGAQSEVNQTILRSLADLHAKVDSQTHVSKMILEKTPTKFSFDLGTSQFTESDRVLLNQVSQRVQDHHLLLGGIHKNASRLLGATASPSSIPPVNIFEREKPVVHDSNNGETSASSDDDDDSSGNYDFTVDHDAIFEEGVADQDRDATALSVEGEQLRASPRTVDLSIGGEQQPVVSSQKQPVVVTSILEETDALARREGKAPMTPNEEVVEANTDKISKDQAEDTRSEKHILQAPTPIGNILPLLGISAEDAAKSVALQKQFDESNKSQVLMEQQFDDSKAREGINTSEQIIDPLQKKDDQLKKEKRIKWYNNSVHCRYIATTITSTQIKGPQNLTCDSDQVFLVIGRANGIVRTEKLSWMYAYGVSEWIETIKFIKTSQSMYRGYVLSYFDQLMKKILIIKTHYKLSDPPQLSFLKTDATD